MIFLRNISLFSHFFLVCRFFIVFSFVGLSLSMRIFFYFLLIRHCRLFTASFYPLSNFRRALHALLTLYALADNEAGLLFLVCACDRERKCSAQLFTHFISIDVRSMRMIKNQTKYFKLFFYYYFHLPIFPSSIFWYLSYISLPFGAINNFPFPFPRHTMSTFQKNKIMQINWLKIALMISAHLVVVVVVGIGLMTDFPNFD